MINELRKGASEERTVRKAVRAERTEFGELVVSAVDLREGLISR